LHLTPPVFDPEPIRSRTLPAGLDEYRQPFEGYDEVLARYSEWLLARREDKWDVVDVHGPLAKYLAQERRRDPGYRLANDGVHINPTGHWLMAREVLRHWGLPAAELDSAASGEQLLAAHPHGLDVLRLVQKKQRLLKDSWLTATGHQRPGMKQGVPRDEADRQARELDSEIRTLLTPTP